MAIPSPWNKVTAYYQGYIRTLASKKYVDEAKSDGSTYTTYSIMVYLVEHNIPHLRGKCWTPALIASILANPIYAQADPDLYEFFRSQGAEIVNSVELWQGGGCYLYRPAGTTQGTMRSYKGCTVVLAPHVGVIPSDMWIRARMRALTGQGPRPSAASPPGWWAR